MWLTSTLCTLPCFAASYPGITFSASLSKILERFCGSLNPTSTSSRSRIIRSQILLKEHSSPLSRTPQAKTLISTTMGPLETATFMGSPLKDYSIMEVSCILVLCTATALGETCALGISHRRFTI